MATQRAVCVGINYPGTSAALNGCVNDAHDWAELLTNNGYEVVQLLDNSATKTNIVLALTVAISAMKRGDRLVFTYSGHGTWVYDTDGDEDDKRDEALVPIDYSTDFMPMSTKVHGYKIQPTGVHVFYGVSLQ